MKTNSKFDEVKRNGKQYLLQLRKSTDSDIIEKLESQENKYVWRGVTERQHARQRNRRTNR